MVVTRGYLRTYAVTLQRRQLFLLSFCNIQDATLANYAVSTAINNEVQDGSTDIHRPAGPELSNSNDLSVILRVDEISVKQGMTVCEVTLVTSLNT